MTYFTRTPTGRLKAPKPPATENPSRSDKAHNLFMEPMAKVGDYVHAWGSAVSAGTVGRLKEISDFYPGLGHGCSVEQLDGTIGDHWLWFLRTIPAAAVQEVIDFYEVEEKRPKRIKDRLGL